MNQAQKTIKILAICLAIFIMISIFNGIFYAIQWVGGFGFSSSGEFYKHTYTDIQNIKIDINASNVIIEEGNELSVEANNVSRSFQTSVKNKTLEVKEKFNWFQRHYKGEIIITIPKTADLESLKIDTGAGKITIDQISANRLKIDHGAGYLKMTNSIFKEADIDGGAGLLEITSSTLRDLNLDAGVGKVTLGENIYGKSKIDCGVGEMNFLLKKKEDYTIEVEKGIGTVKIDGQEVKSQKIGTGNNLLDIHGGIGSININFER